MANIVCFNVKPVFMSTKNKKQTNKQTNKQTKILSSTLAKITILQQQQRYVKADI